MMNEYRNEFVAPQIRPYFLNAQGVGDQGEQHAITQENEQADFGVINPQITLSVQEAEQRFSVEELSKIKKEFERLSKDNVIGKRKLLEYFKLLEIQDTYLANEVFFMIKNSSQLNSPIDYSKFINFVSIVSKGNEEEKLQLLYTFFDRSVESKITKEDLKAHISGTILSMQSVAFDGLDELEKLKSSIAMAPENEIDQALDILVQEIFL